MSLTRVVTLCTICIMLVLGGCSKDETTAPTDNNNNNNNEVLGKSSISATVDGSSWSSSLTQTHILGDAVYVNGMNMSAEMLDFTIKSGLPVGTYSTSNEENNISLDYTTIQGTDYKSWRASSTRGNLSVTITKSNSKELEGTFSGTVAMQLASGGTDDKNITNGKFYINLTK